MFEEVSVIVLVVVYAVADSSLVMPKGSSSTLVIALTYTGKFPINMCL